MDIQSLVQYKKSKRRERAARMAEEPVSLLDDLDSAEEDTDLLKLKPQRPPRPKKVQERLKDPLYEEDIVEGFSFCSFMSYEDLDVGFYYSRQRLRNYAGFSKKFVKSIDELLNYKAVNCKTIHSF